VRSEDGLSNNDAWTEWAEQGRASEKGAGAVVQGQSAAGRHRRPRSRKHAGLEGDMRVGEGGPGTRLRTSVFYFDVRGQTI
jgi:hypothetical protein